MSKQFYIGPYIELRVDSDFEFPDTLHKITCLKKESVQDGFLIVAIPSELKGESLELLPTIEMQDLDMQKSIVDLEYSLGSEITQLETICSFENVEIKFGIVFFCLHSAPGSRKKGHDNV